MRDATSASTRKPGSHSCQRTARHGCGITLCCSIPQLERKDTVTKEVLRRTWTDFLCTRMTDKDRTMTFLEQRTAEESFAVIRVAFQCPTVYSLFHMAAVACKTQTRETLQISLGQWFLLCTTSLLMSYWWSSKVPVILRSLVQVRRHCVSRIYCFNTGRIVSQHLMPWRTVQHCLQIEQAYWGILLSEIYSTRNISGLTPSCYPQRHAVTFLFSFESTVWFLTPTPINFPIYRHRSLPDR